MNINTALDAKKYFKYVYYIHININGRDSRNYIFLNYFLLYILFTILVY